MIEKLFFSSTDLEPGDLVDLEAKTKANLSKVPGVSTKDLWTKKAGKTGMLSLIAASNTSSSV